jgi:hypothetical protein
MRRILAGALAALMAVAVVGCGKEAKPTIPDKLIEPPGPDGDAGSPSGKKKRDADAKQGKQETGEDK